MSRPICIVVLIDALGWSYVRDAQFLNAELPYRQPLRTVLGFSSGAIPTLLTGQTPAQTGHWNLFYYDPAHSPFRWLRPFRMLPPRLLDNRYTRALLKHVGRRVLGLGRLFECSVRPSLLPWFNWVEKKNIFAPGGITGAASVFDRLQQAALPFRAYSYHDGSDEELMRRALDDVRGSDARFFFVYLCEMDAFLHHHCTEPDRIAARLHWYGMKLHELLAAAREIDPQARMVVTSDHGMAPVRKHYDLVADIERLGFRMPQDYLAVYDSTMARFWFFSDAARQKIIATLQSVAVGRVLSQAELLGLGLNFPDRRYGDVVFLLEPGCIVAESDFNSASWMPLGMHGYHPDDPDSDAIFLCSEPPGFTPRSIADVYRWIVEKVDWPHADRESVSLTGQG